MVSSNFPVCGCLKHSLSIQGFPTSCFWRRGLRLIPSEQRWLTLSSMTEVELKLFSRAQGMLRHISSEAGSRMNSTNSQAVFTPTTSEAQVFQTAVWTKESCDLSFRTVGPQIYPNSPCGLNLSKTNVTYKFRQELKGISDLSLQQQKASARPHFSRGHWHNFPLITKKPQTSTHCQMTSYLPLYNKGITHAVNDGRGLRHAIWEASSLRPPQ